MLGLKSLVMEALAEDIGQGDITTDATIPSGTRCFATVTAKQNGVLSGVVPFRTVFECLDAHLTDWEALPDGARFGEGGEIISFIGASSAVLTGERVALNFLQRLSGIATLTAAYMAAVNGLPVKVCDTRKTTPLLRRFEKDAVVHGGGSNHRYALFDGVLIKENHIMAAGGIKQAVQSAWQGTHHLMKIGIEVTSLGELEEAVAAGADAIILDNMSLADTREAVLRTQGKRIVLESSGNVTLDRVRAIAETGVHVISVGALTHSAPAIDLSLRISNA